MSSISFPIVQGRLTDDETTFVQDITLAGGYDDSGTWTPVVTAATPGNLSVAYSEQVGTYIEIGGLVILFYRINISTFTHTTAASTFLITGLPFTSLVEGTGNVSFYKQLPTVGATRTFVAPVVTVGDNKMSFRPHGDMVNTTTVSITDIPTTTLFTLNGNLIYVK